MPRCSILEILSHQVCRGYSTYLLEIEVVVKEARNALIYCVWQPSCGPCVLSQSTVVWGSALTVSRSCPSLCSASDPDPKIPNTDNSVPTRHPDLTLHSERAGNTDDTIPMTS